MKIKFVSVGAALAVSWLSGSLFAGQYLQDFNAVSFGATNFGDGSVFASSNLGGSAGVFGVNKELQLSIRTGLNTRSSFLLPDLNTNQPDYAFSAQWDSLVQGYFQAGLGGEGFSLNFGQLAALNLIGSNFNQEDGYGTGISVGVRTQNTNAPGYYLRVNGVVVTNVANVPVNQWGDNIVSNHLFQVDWNASRGLTLRVDGAVIFSNAPTSGFTPQSGDRLAWGNRTSSHAEFFRLDNIVVNTGSRLGVGAPVLTNAAIGPNFFTASVDPRGLDTTVVMEVGTNTAYGTSVTNFIAANTNGLVAIINYVSRLVEQPTVLHARIRVTNVAGTAVSQDLTFTTPGFELRASKRLGNLSLSPLTDAVVWLDADDDGALDLVAIGANLDQHQPDASIWFNPKSSGITNWPFKSYTPAGGLLAFIAAGDLDNDNVPDWVWGGGDAGYQSLYSFTHTYVTYGGNNLRGFGLPQYGFTIRNPDGSPDNQFDTPRGVICDFDHDGKQDMLITGYKPPNPGQPEGTFSQMYHNVFSGTKNATSLQNSLIWGLTSIPPMGFNSGGTYYSGSFSISVGDLDGDGFLDVYAYAGDYGHWSVFGNNHELDFLELQSGPSAPVELNNVDYLGGASSVWADFNGDGHADLLVAEGTLSASRNRIFLNDGLGHLTNSNIVLPGWTSCSVAAGDIFNHGRNDIVMSGRDTNSSDSFLMVLRNEGNGVFTPLDFGFLPKYCRTGLGIALADYDQDGRLDIAAVGGIVDYGVNSHGDLLLDATSVYRNVLDIPTNHPPGATGGLSTTVGAGTVTFHWNTATDDITPTNLLTYNLRVGTNTLGTQTVSPLANVTNGWRKIAAPGNVGHCFNTLYRFPPGTYYWSVQAVDGAFAGGAWATEQTFTITNPERPVLDIARATINQHAVKWPARFPDYTMQQKSSLTSTNWTVVTNSPVVNYGKLTVNVTNAPAAKFFRLSKP